jgi:chromosome segregation ATPase
MAFANRADYRDGWDYQAAHRAFTDARVNTQTTLSAAAKNKIAALEDEVRSTREELVHGDNENHSLQTSLNLIADENARLTRCLADHEAALDRDHSELERIKMAAAAAEIERGQLASALTQLNKKRDTETAALNTYLDVMCSRATAAEQELEETQRSLAVHAEDSNHLADENSRLWDCLAERDTAIDAANAQLEQVKAALAAATTARDAALETANAQRDEMQAALAAAAAERDAALAAADSRLEATNAALAAVTAERDHLAAALADAKESRQAEVDDFQVRLDAMSSRAVTAEGLLADVRQKLLEKVELLQNSLQVKTHQVEEFKELYAKLINNPHMLLKFAAARDLRLAAANGALAEPSIWADGRVQACRSDMLLASTITL